MEHPFKVGDRVVCVEPNFGVKKGLEYTVSKLYWGSNQNGRGPDEPMVKLSGSNTGYYARRFELLTPLKQEEQIPWWEGEKT